MAKKAGKTPRFVKGMIVYAVVFLLLTGVGLYFFWQFIDAYEQSRSKTAVDAFVSGLTEEQLRKGSEAFLGTLNGELQTEEEAFALIQQSMTGELTYAKLGRESSVSQQVYVLRQDGQEVGRLTICPGPEGDFGFTPWIADNWSFVFPHLIAEPVSVTVSQDYTVSVNGHKLGEAYITETDIPYPALEDFWGDFDMVSMVTYRAESFLGEPVVTIQDSAGSNVDVTGETDPDSMIPVCSQEEESVLRPLLETFLQRYVAFTGSANRNEGANYQRLIKCLVPNGELAKRLYTALDGLHYAQSNGDTIKDITVNHFYKISEERWMCDVTYIVETIGRNGAVQMENNLKVIFLQTEDGPKVEAMTRY